MRRQLFAIMIMALAAGLPMTASAGVMDWFTGASKSELVEHSSGGTIERENGRYKKGTFLPAIAGPALKHSSGGSIIAQGGRYVSETYARIPAPVRNRLASKGAQRVAMGVTASAATLTAPAWAPAIAFAATTVGAAALAYDAYDYLYLED
ncbi:hypothetical protein [Limimaricola pyoseonensis]|uniref:hypothetical protein n=1 Tax=Limimaricola pyoseonensis TaxID=521013 RepID=UPI001042653C|nr:hypothetical protein [Limimaricola pyoseonensis]